MHYTCLYPTTFDFERLSPNVSINPLITLIPPNERGLAQKISTFFLASTLTRSPWAPQRRTTAPLLAGAGKHD
ncbi:hypothetical protein Y032_0003g1458 [Ancylostoma ceylanicum]|uniref:Uncharacterized protein n=1 Tax=Ancylostoma ceylanicum TaxID=53326 RepID=A0A016VX81_9BILA|nr:hypothetical protein Y032_0003g1458 [Ancylostoma ceylanicum]